MDLTTPSGRRRLIIDVARRRIRPGSGSSLEFLRGRTWHDPEIDVDLHSLDARYVIVGGVATALYMPRRMTLNLDLLVLWSDAERIAAALRAAGTEPVKPLTFGGHAWRTLGGATLHVLMSDEAWAVEALAHPAHSPTDLAVIALPYLVLMKLDASRSYDLGDVSRMLGAADEATRHRVREVIRRYRPDYVEDVESLIALGALEYQDG